MKSLEIDVKDLELNIAKIKEQAGNIKIIAVVKGNGYGLGLKELSEFLANYGINDFAVSSVEEALELKQYLPAAKVLCMEATSIIEELDKLLDNDISVTIGDYETSTILNQLAKEKNKKANVHIKIDTGFSRYGFKFNDKETILKSITENSSLFVEGVFSHFSQAYFEKSDYTKLQFERFITVKSYLEKNNIKIAMYHIANSSAFLKYKDMYLDAVRIGSAFLGRVSVKNNIGLKRIGVLKSNVVSIKNVTKGTAIGYSNSEIAKKDMKLAIVPVGYADGFNVGVKNDTFKFVDKLRLTKDAVINIFKDNRIFVYINGKKYFVIGKVGMNHIAVDVTNEKVEINDIVKLEASPILVNSKIRREYK